MRQQGALWGAPEKRSRVQKKRSRVQKKASPGLVEMLQQRGREVDELGYVSEQ